MREHNLTFRLNAGIRFNRPINVDQDYISPGGYCFVMKGNEMTFDFEEYSGSISEDDPTVLEIECKNPDFEFEDTAFISKTMLKNVSAIEEFFVYTGEPGETDLKPVELTYCKFVLPYDNWKAIPVKKDVLKTAEVCSNIE